MGSGAECHDKECLGVPDELVQYIKTGSKFIIVGHKEPDGDCVGSQLALRNALLRMGKEAKVSSAGPFKRAELKNYEGQFTEIPKEKENLKIIVVDCSGMERTGNLQELLKSYPCAVIDHHEAVTHPPSSVQQPIYVDANSPSCTLLIEKLINALGLDLTNEEADLLLFGLCTDTGFFRHLTDKNAYVFEAAARMVKRGANPKEIYKIMNGGKSLNSRLLMGNVLSRTESYFGGKLLISYETLKEFKKYGYEGRDSDNLNKMLLSVEGVEAVVIIRQECADSCTVSLRSMDKVDVSRIAASFGGGGHKNASGFTMKGKVSNLKKKITKSFKIIFE
jgi:bifunctional oligoribonuclease and PAP phosphatase NrnA